MPLPIMPPPFSEKEPVTDFLHGVRITDPYRWLEDPESQRTQSWIQQQALYARNYLDGIPGRNTIRKRVCELADIETYDSILKNKERYFFRKRHTGQEQPCVYMRDGANGEDQLLIDPRKRTGSKYVAVRPLKISPDGRLLLYEVKEGGERSGIFELLEVNTRTRLVDFLPRGYLRGFAFAPDSQSFYYVHEPLDNRQPVARAAYRHVLGTRCAEDEMVFSPKQDANIRLSLTSDQTRIAYLIYRFLDKIVTDIYLGSFGSPSSPKLLIRDADFQLGLCLVAGKMLAITDRDAINRRIVEIQVDKNGATVWRDLVPEADVPIQNWLVAGRRIFVSYYRGRVQQIRVFDLFGKALAELPTNIDETIRIVCGSPEEDELFLELESFTKPTAIFRQPTRGKRRILWARKTLPFADENYAHRCEWFSSKDGTQVPIYLVAQRRVLEKRANPTIMTSYGGFGVPVTPQFSVFVAVLMELGCLFALPNIRGGSEFGPDWHNAGKRRSRQTAYDDFLSAAEWLLGTGRTAADKLAIFGGSNSGLLVGAALTQRPDLFRAAICMVPVLDMLRYHLFDNALAWKEEFGTADNLEDFIALAKYSPYHQVREGVAYPATMFVSGEVDGNCNPLHARKMTARLQTANFSGNPIILEYNRFRGHSPVLPLSDRLEALTDRVAFLSDHLQLPPLYEESL